MANDARVEAAARAIYEMAAKGVDGAYAWEAAPEDDLMRLVARADELDLLLRIERRGPDHWVVWATDSGFSGAVPASKGRTLQGACSRALEAMAGVPDAH